MAFIQNLHPVHPSQILSSIFCAIYNSLSGFLFSNSLPSATHIHSPNLGGRGEFSFTDQFHPSKSLMSTHMGSQFTTLARSAVEWGNIICSIVHQWFKKIKSTLSMSNKPLPVLSTTCNHSPHCKQAISQLNRLYFFTMFLMCLFLSTYQDIRNSVPWKEQYTSAMPISCSQTLNPCLLVKLS